jgi:photosystem II stability/assembly factor-like uncharacterized protein
MRPTRGFSTPRCGNTGGGPWQVISGGPGSGLYKSTDGGETWQKMTGGLPDKMGKMAIAVSRSNPEKVYALIEGDSYSPNRGLYVSGNAGKSWSLVSSDNRLVQRAWYYIEVFVDPKDENRVYVLSAPALRSNDGGQDLGERGRPARRHPRHVDQPGQLRQLHPVGRRRGRGHVRPREELVHPPQPADRDSSTGSTSTTSSPTGSTRASRTTRRSRSPTASSGAGGVSERSWTYSAGGESAFLAVRSGQSALCDGRELRGDDRAARHRRRPHRRTSCPAPIQYLGRDAKDMKYRYNWNAPIIWSKYEPNTFYHGAQLLLKTSDFGKTWKEVSPDLTRNEKEKQGTPGVPYTNEAVGAENYGTLAYVVESPHEKGVIWTGSDDGYVQVTRDGGTTWKNVTPKGLAECLINAIEISPFDKGTAYIATTRYKFNDFAPGLYKTTDYGATWTKIDAGIPAKRVHPGRA